MSTLGVSSRVHLNRAGAPNSQNSTSFHRLLYWRRSVAAISEIVLSGLTYGIASGLLRDHIGVSRRDVLLALPLLLLTRFAGYYAFGLFKRSHRYASLSDVLSIGKAVGSSSLAFYAIVRITRSSLPLVLIVLDSALLLFLLGGLHFALRLLRRHLALHHAFSKSVLIVGAGDAGTALIKELEMDCSSEQSPVGFVDDDSDKQGAMICGVPVLGKIDDLPRIARWKKIDEVIICIQNATRAQKQRLLRLCRCCDLPVRTLRSLGEKAQSRIPFTEIHDVEIEDLLQRDTMTPDPATARGVVGGRVALVTGAGGSIGSELSRQIAAAGPSKLILVDKSENSLFYIEREIRERFPIAVRPLLLDVSRRDAVRRAFAANRPDVVFHAAAHKHVRLLELCPEEAIRNNVIGCRNVGMAAHEFRCERFVNISTDKAVYPKCYMGLSKKVTELCVKELAGQSSTRFMNVRFGNVAGSTASVIRLFREQVSKGLPVTVSDPRATRYFMTIPEAVNLILQAAGSGTSGETFIFDMGEPVNIYELARTVILFSGLRPGKDVPIHFTGLTKGEKVEEELWEECEKPRPTTMRRILAIHGGSRVSTAIIPQIDELEELLTLRGTEQAIAFFEQLVPGFLSRRKFEVTSAHERSEIAAAVTGAA